MVLAGVDLLARVQAVARQTGDPAPEREAAVGCHCDAVAEVPGLAERLVRYAVLADRQAGAGWARIGAALGTSGEAARRRFGHVRDLSGEERGPRGEATSAVCSGMEFLDTILRQAVRETGASAGMVYLLSPCGQVLRLATMTGVPPKVTALWERLLLPASGPVADAVRERRLVWLASQAALVRRYPRAALVLPYPVALAAAPVTSGATVRGGLVLLWPESRPSHLSAQERAVIRSTCDRTGAFLQHAAEDGHPISPEEPHMTAPPRPRTGARTAVDFGDRPAEGCCVLDAEGRIAFISATAADLVGGGVPELLGAPLWEALPWLDDPVFEDRYRAAVLGRRPTSFTAVRPPDRWLSFQLRPDASGVSVRVSPTERTTPVDHPGPGHGAGTATPARAGTLYDLMHVAGALTKAVSVRDVVELTADLVLPAFGAQGFVLSVAEGDRLRVVGHRGYSAKVISALDLPPFRDESAPTVRAVTMGVPLFFASRREMAQLAPEIPRLTKRAAWAFLPLLASSRPVGCCVVSYDQPHDFTPDERAVLTSLAGLIAQALDRARLYDAEHQLARSLQSGLLPATLPTVPGLEVAARYLPTACGMDIGGDFYDLIRCDATTVAAAIGDVQGHSVNAAVLMGQVRTAVHATAGAPPGEVLARTNRLLTDLDPGLFTSCLYAHIDLAHHLAHLATAGHLPPLLRHPDGHTEVLHLPPGLLLGIDPDADYPATEIPLPPGAVLALYTDGLVESPDVDLDDATANLADQLAQAQDQPMATLADTLIHHDPHTDPRSDDIALLLLHPQPDRG
ncbi:Phosphoserine phosphatase RsbU [Streptomyces malaysiensis subsp. malaysiensis]|uniref:SpoIIE family protein phosphatase n=1 Tax=Streptomyces malaysiensis TaxID=92644 RepID=UPI000CA2B502|nr:MULTISPECIES: SpoIIE family protein phosphatase [unclassified Streptomyces]AUA16388.1 Phosphoserine phosphatase RsbU [Streptomyces sp. M56]